MTESGTLSAPQLQCFQKFTNGLAKYPHRCAAHFNVPTMFTNSCNLSQGSFKTILWILFNISGRVTSFCRPLRCSSWQVVWLYLNAAAQYFIVVNEGTDSH